MSSDHERLGYALKAAQGALGRAMDAALRPEGLTVAQFATLNALDRAPGASNADLARRAFVTPQSMHGVLDGLARAGLVERGPDPGHGRRLAARLTARGTDALARGWAAVAPVEATLEGACAPLPPDAALAFLARARAVFGDG
jgi:DNA-binding MarR family transcriptional regulator